MFVLRQVDSKNRESNCCIGDKYNFISEEICPEEFKKLENDFFNQVYDDGVVYAFICFNDGSGILPLFKTQRNYIMNENGGLFANVSFKIKKHIGSRASILKVVPVLNDEDRMNYIGYSAMHNDKTKYTTAFYKMIVGNMIIPKYADDFCLKEINDYDKEV